MMRAISIAVVAACGSTSKPVAKTVELPGRPPRLGELGKPVPYRIVEIPEDGRWAITCEARVDTYPDDGKLAAYYDDHGGDAGDALVAYLYDGDGLEHEITAYLARDPTGRWLAIVEGEDSVLIDTRTWTRQRVTATRPQFHITTGRHDWDFDPTGQRVLFFRGDALVVRELATAKETVVAAKVWSAHWNGSGDWITYETLDGDSNHDGFTNGPDRSPPVGMGGSSCGRRFQWGPPLADMVADGDPKRMEAGLVAMDHPDELTHHLWRVSDRLAVLGVGAVDRDLIVTRAANGSLRIGAPSGPTRELAPAKCEATAAYPAARSVLVVCPTGEAAATLWWYRDGTRRELMSVADASPRVEGDGTRYFGIYPRQAIIDMQSGKVIADGKRLYHEWSDATRVFIIFTEPRHAELRWESGKRITFPSYDGAARNVAPPYLVHYKSRVNIDTGVVLALASEPLLVRSDGAILLDGGLQKLDEPDHAPRVGPLRWVMP